MKRSLRLNTLLRVGSVALLTHVLLVTTTFGQAAAPQTTATLTAAERKAAKSLKVETVREMTTALADRSMEGRGTGQPGGDRAAKYIADKFAKLGLKPLGDTGSFLQAVSFKSIELKPETSAKVGDVTFKLGDDFVPAPPYTADKLTSTGSVVFVGYGVTSETLKRDELAGLDVKGKIVMIIGGRPKNIDEAAWNQEASQQSIAMNLIMRGVGGVMIANIGSSERPFSLISSYLTRRRVALAGTPEPPFKLPPIVLLSDSAAERVFAATGMTYAETLVKAASGEVVSRELNKTATLNVVVKREQVVSNNVVGILEGSDVKLKDQAVVYTAHYDAYGIDSFGHIFPGAADNALGVGEITAIAEAFIKSNIKPRRSIIFLAVTGEEYGLLGAEYWVKHPTWPIEKIAADLNYDGIGTEVYAPVKKIVGFGAEYSDLGATLKDVLTATGMILTPDPLPEEGAFYRSDHYAFVKTGVPALMLLGGPDGDVSKWIGRAKAWMDTDYHQPGDVVRSDWVWDGARSVAVVGFVMGIRIANAEAVPQWLTSSPFKRARGAGEPPPSEKN